MSSYCAHLLYLLYIFFRKKDIQSCTNTMYMNSKLKQYNNSLCSRYGYGHRCLPADLKSFSFHSLLN